MVRQLRQNRGFSTAKLAKATVTPVGVCTWVSFAQGTLEVGYGQSLRQQVRPQTLRVLLHQRSLTVAYVRLSEAQFVNVGTELPLPLHPQVAADLASGERDSSGQRLRSSRRGHVRPGRR